MFKFVYPFFFILLVSIGCWPAPVYINTKHFKIITPYPQINRNICHRLKNWESYKSRNLKSLTDLPVLALSGQIYLPISGEGLMFFVLLDLVLKLISFTYLQQSRGERYSVSSGSKICYGTQSISSRGGNLCLCADPKK